MDQEQLYQIEGDGRSLGEFFQELSNKYQSEGGSAIVLTIHPDGHSEISLEQGECSQMEIIQELSWAVQTMLHWWDGKEMGDG